VAYAVLPLFALANTGVPIDQAAIAELSHANSIGIALGLVIGKPLGVIVMCVLAVATGVCSLPANVRWHHMAGAGLLGGIGFTMSIFITNLAFADHATIVNSSKLAVLAASMVAGALGLAWLRLAPDRDHA
jgi:NhaA family Na+:H+ antiporter